LFHFFNQDIVVIKKHCSNCSYYQPTSLNNKGRNEKIHNEQMVNASKSFGTTASVYLSVDCRILN